MVDCQRTVVFVQNLGKNRPMGPEMLLCKREIKERTQKDVSEKHRSDNLFDVVVAESELHSARLEEEYHCSNIELRLNKNVNAPQRILKVSDVLHLTAIHAKGGT